MATLLLRLAGPMQSWGTTSRFDQRDTGKEPSKSGVLGLVAAAMGIDRSNWEYLEPLCRLAMAVRHDRPGIPKRDYQTAGCAATDTIIKADGTQARGGGVVSERHYLADAAFVVGLEGQDRELLARIQVALRDPVWGLSLGRRSYLPSEPVWMEDGLRDGPALEVLRRLPWTVSVRKGEDPPGKLLLSHELADGDGVLRMDQPLSSFAERRFGARLVRSEWIPFPREVADATA